MSQELAVAFATAVACRDDDPRLAVLLRAIAEAWVQAESSPHIVSESEARRWSAVCTAAAELVQS